MLFIALLWGASASCTPQADNDDPQDRFQRQALDQWLEHLHENDRFTGSVAVRQGEQVLYEYQAGPAGREEGVDITPDTRFRAGSITKPFTSVIILQLAAEDRLSLDDRLAEYFRELPNADRITLEQMLRHRSGLYNYTSAEDFQDWMTEPHSREQMLDRLADLEPVFEPGERAEYSNANYLLLGYIIEDVTGGSYADALRERIIEPLGLEHTGFGGTISVADGDARSYDYDEDEARWEPAPETDMSVAHAAGALVTTPRDLTRFTQALFAGELLEQRYLDRMTELQDGYGLGLIVSAQSFEQFDGYGHSGGIDAFRSSLVHIPEEQLSLAFTASALRFSGNRIIEAMIRAWMGEEPELPELEQVQLPEAHLQRLAGDYESDALPMDIALRVEDGRLTVQASNQPAFPLAASSETRFRLDEADAVIEFEEPEDPDAGYDRFILRQSGGAFEFTRK